MTLASQDQALLDTIAAGPGAAQRRAVAKAITLLESTRADHRLRADALLNALLPASGRALRLGIRLPRLQPGQVRPAASIWNLYDCHVSLPARPRGSCQRR